MSYFKVAVSISAEEVEQDRRSRLAEAVADHETTSAELAADFAPGTFGCHEALHTTSVVMSLVDERIASHPAVLTTPDWFRLAHEAHVALYNLYQAIGEVHAGDQSDEEICDA